MVVESHIPFGGEAEPPQDEVSFEPAKPRRRSRRERRVEHSRTHEKVHVLEPHVIWTREDPNHLQPLKVAAPASEHIKQMHETVPPHKEHKAARSTNHEPGQAQQEKVAEHPKRVMSSTEKQREENPRTRPPAPDIASMLPSESAMPAPQKREASSERSPQPEPLAELLKLQELPKLNIQRRNFYTEPEVRQPNTTETEHDILPPAHEVGQSTGPAVSAEQSKPAVSEMPVIPGLASATGPEHGIGAGHTEWEQPAGISGAPEQFRVGEQLQYGAELSGKAKERRLGAAPEAVSKEGFASQENQSGRNEIDVNMERADLLALADSIRVDGISVSEIFHAGRLDDEGLRRIVAAFLRGHDVERAVAEEVLRVQMRFERDPQLRQTALKRSSRATKRAAGATVQAKKIFDPKRAMYHADNLADRLASGFDRIMESGENQPNFAKTVGIALAVVIYFAILILILKS